MKKIIMLFVLAHLFAIGLHAGPEPPSLPKTKDGMLELLDRMIEQRHTHFARRRAKADSIRHLLRRETDPRALAARYVELGDVESELSTDSTIAAYDRGIAIGKMLGDSVMVQNFVLRRVTPYINSGMMHEGLEDYEREASKGIYPENEYIYHRVGSLNYLMLGAFYDYDDIDNHHTRLGLEHSREWQKLTKPGTAEHLYAKALAYLGEGKSQLMAATLHDCVEAAKFTDFEYGRALIILGEYYWNSGNLDEAVYNYAQSACSYIYNANLEGVALLRLGELLYSMGDAIRSHTYLAISLEKAIQANEKFNLMRINDAYMEVSKIVDSKKYQWIYVLAGFLALLIVAFIIVYRIMQEKRKQVKNLKRTERQLARANLAKETYISEFMNLSSSYIESLEEYNKMCRRKLTAGQTEDLMAYIKSGKVLEQARKKFYDVFDEALFHLFPDFIDQVNRLLQPDKKIVTNDPNTLTTELRVAAMSRLGIEDAAVIARFLGISTNTIYTYRNKLRTRAINRATIEEDIRRIGSVESA